MIKLTPKGKRFGDVVRKLLKDPEHHVTQSVRQWKAWAQLERLNPKKCKLINRHGDLFFVEFGKGWSHEFNTTSPLIMGNFWNA